MIAYEATLTDGAWTELLGGLTNLNIDIKEARGMALTFTESADTPAIDAPFVEVLSYPHGFDYASSGMQPNQRVWGRALKDDEINIVVVR